MYGIQVNVGRVPEPDWRWVHRPDMVRAEFQTEAEVTAQKEMWYPGAKAAIFRVKEIEA